MRGTMSGRSRGFTIIEVLIVIIVIAIIATITIVSYNSISQRAKESALQADLTQASTKLNSERHENGTYPTDLTEVSLEASSDTTYQYTYNSVANNYCLTATNSNNDAYHVAINNDPVEGPCNGHTGNPPDDLSCPTGYITVPGNSLLGTKAFCVMKYEAKNVSGVATSQATGTPWVSISQTAAITTAAAACSGCHLITEAEWLTIAQNVMSVGSNWSGGTVGSGSMYRGHTDNAPANSLAASTDSDNYSGTGQTTGEQRRTLTLSNGVTIWDFSGNINEWTSGMFQAGGQPGLAGESSLAWKEWNNVALIQGDLSDMVYPRYGNGTAGGWDGTQGIGRLYSNYGDTLARSFARGGAYNSTTNAGPFTINAGNIASTSAATIGFRVAK